MECAIIRSSPTWELAYKQAIRNFHKIATELDTGSDSALVSQSENINSVEKSDSEADLNLRTVTNVVQVRPDVSSKSAIASSRPKPKHEAHTTALSTHSESYSVPSRILSMPIYKPLMLEDYWSAERVVGQNIPLRVQILHRGLLTAYQALRDEFGNKSRLGAWFSRSHRFSLPHTNQSTLLFLTRHSLSRLTVDLDEGSQQTPPLPVGENIFYGQHYEHLSHAVQREMELSGLHTEDLLYPDDIEAYLENKGQLSMNNSELRLRMRFPVAEQGLRSEDAVNEKLVKIDVNRLINRLVDGALCVGNGIAFPKTDVNNAIVFAATSLTDVDY